MSSITEGRKQIEQLLVLSDAVIAFAITLLALDLRLDNHQAGIELQFADLDPLKYKFLAFVLSFINIAVMWSIYHDFFDYVAKVNRKIIIYNLLFLFFITTIPFASSLISAHFGQFVSSFIYSVNILLISILFKYMWRYILLHPSYAQKNITQDVMNRFNTSCNVGVINGFIAVAVSYWLPTLSFLILLARPVTTYLIKFMRQR